jgi:hypothetical protein
VKSAEKCQRERGKEELVDFKEQGGNMVKLLSDGEEGE